MSVLSIRRNSLLRRPATYITIAALILCDQLVLSYTSVNYTVVGWELCFNLAFVAFCLWRFKKPAAQSESRAAREEHVYQMEQSEKLTLIGVLAAGIAHEIRNPLTSLRGFVQLMRDKQPEYTGIMLSEIDRINTIVTELLDLAKPRIARFETKPVKVLLDGVIALMESQASLYNIELRSAWQGVSDKTAIHCEENKLKQVLINLIKNGIESMPDGGILAIHGYREDGHIRIVIQDEGAGMSEEQLAHIGKPFHTTKDKGTGLGVMISQTIIGEHQGTIQFRSKLGSGTAVEIMLPERSV